MSNTYYVSCPGDNWTKTKAKTLAGAKRVATRLYQVSASGRIEVGVNIKQSDYDMGASIATLSVKRGYDTWQDVR